MQRYLLMIALQICFQLSAVCVRPVAQEAQENPGTRSRPAQCTGKASDCKEPVKFLSKEDECVCYACEYGTSNQKAVCTTSKDEAKLLAEKEEDTERRHREFEAAHPDR